jgi:hypothetical protein
MSLKIDEMIVNTVLNGTKYRHISWNKEEYIYWCRNNDTHIFRNELNEPEDINDFATELKGWVEYNEKK